MDSDAEEGSDLLLSDSRLLALVQPGVPSEKIDWAIFHLTYKQHGGSGTNLTLGEVEAMDWTRFCRWSEMLEEQRTSEQRALEKAARKK